MTKVPSTDAAVTRCTLSVTAPDLRKRPLDLGAATLSERFEDGFEYAAFVMVTLLAIRDLGGHVVDERGVWLCARMGLRLVQDQVRAVPAPADVEILVVASSFLGEWSQEPAFYLVGVAA